MIFFKKESKERDKMSKTDILKHLVDIDNGYLITAKALNAGVSKPTISKFTKDYKMEKVAHGIYIYDEIWPDELFILQEKNKSIIYSDETALYLHRLIDREYSRICFTVPNGYNATHIKDCNKKIHYVNPKIWKMGICQKPSLSGNLVTLYNKERCICEMIKNRDKYEVQMYQTAMKEYMTSKDKNLSLLVEYADKLGVRNKVMMYVEVMG